MNESRPMGEVAGAQMEVRRAVLAKAAQPLTRRAPATITTSAGRMQRMSLALRQTGPGRPTACWKKQHQ